MTGIGAPFGACVVMAILDLMIHHMRNIRPRQRARPAMKIASKATLDQQENGDLLRIFEL
jgi:hypothetical protein